MASELQIKLHLESTHLPGILDLEGEIPFDIVLQGRRGTTDLSRTMNILIDDSLFDIPYALSKGLLKFIDLGSKEEFDLGFIDTSLKPSPRIITIPPRASRLRVFEYDFAIPLRLSTHLRSILVPDHEYRVELSTFDLGVKWWGYGDDVDLELLASTSSLPPSKPTQLVAMKTTHRDFSVVKSLPKPPKVTISISLSSNIIHRSHQNPPTYLRVIITNTSNCTISLKSNRDQHFIELSNLAHNTPNHHRITSTNPPPSLDNFSITSLSTGKEFIREPRHTCSLPARSTATKTSTSTSKKRNGLTTLLKPNQPLIHEFPLLERADAIVKRMAETDHEYRLKLRPLGVEWRFEDSSFEEDDDGFSEEAKTILKRLPGLCVPLILQSDDEVVFQLEE